MATQVIFLGICAASRDLLLDWSRSGLLPNLQRAMGRGVTGFINSMPGLYVGATWPSLTTSVSPARHSRHYIVQLEPGTYALSRQPKGAGIRRPPFWQALSQAGRNVALLDVPHTALTGGLNGIQIVEWGAHDGDHQETLTHPASLAEDIAARFGPHPAPRSCDGLKTTLEFAEFRDRLVAGAARRAQLTRHYLQRTDWDFFAQVWTESHCAGHQCWHFHDPSHPLHDPAAADIVGDPIRDVYIAIDRAIGQVLEAVDEKTTVILFNGHGMGPKYDAQFLLDDVLLRLGHARSPEPEVAAVKAAAVARHRRVDDFLTRGWQALPPTLKNLAAPIRKTLRGAVADRRPAPAPKIDRQRSQCFTVPNNSAHGGIRLNVAGREPAGTVQRGAQFDTLCERITRDIMEIVNPASDEPIADRILRTDSVYAGEALDALPDLLVEWNQNHPVHAIESDKIGRLEGVDPYNRTGDHRKGGMFVAMGPGLRAGRLERAVDVTDFGPTIARLLNLHLENIDGQAIEELLTRRPQPPATE